MKSSVVSGFKTDARTSLPSRRGARNRPWISSIGDQYSYRRPRLTVRFGRTRHLSCAYADQTLWRSWRRLVAPGTKPDVVLVTLNVCAAVATIPARLA